MKMKNRISALTTSTVLSWRSSAAGWRVFFGIALKTDPAFRTVARFQNVADDINMRSAAFAGARSAAGLFIGRL
jgi:hypothetical protein